MDSSQGIHKYWQELWKSKEEFERNLEEDVHGYKMDMKHLKYRNDEKCTWIKYKASATIEALETALTETKLSY